MTFHHPTGKATGTAAGNKALKKRPVMAGRSRNALVFDGDQAVGWCLFGRPEEVRGG